MLKRMAAIATIALLVLVALAACGREEPEPPKGQVTMIPNVPGAPPQVYGKTPPPEAGTTRTQPAANGGAAQTSVTIDMQDIKFVPKEFTIPANTNVKVTLKNTGALPHDFSIDKLKIAQELDPGKTGEVTINAPAGDYQYYCNQPGHKAAGMVGTMHVVAGGAAAPSGASPAAASPAAVSSPTAAAPAKSPAAQAASSAPTSATVDMEDIKFVPNSFTIAANTNVKVTLQNKGALPHDFSVNDHKNPKVKNLNISVTLQPGKSQTITINAPAGDYYYYCNQPGHEAAGMFGTMHVVAGAAAGGQTGQAPAAQPTQAAQKPASTAAASGAASGGATSLTVDMQDIKFVPNTLAMPANTDVKVTLKNTGALPHNFSIDKLKISQTVQPGKTTEFTLKAPAGTYQFYCDEPGHKAAGMVGTLTVK